MKSPYVPDISVDNFDQNHVNNTEWKDAEQVAAIEATLKQEEVQAVFSVYYYNKLDSSKIMQQPQTTSTKATTQGQTENNGEPLSDDD